MDEPRGLLMLSELAPSDKIYQGVNDNGWLLLRSSLVYNEKQNVHVVTERLLVALALTEVCCEMGKGKLYYFPMPSQAQLDSVPPGSNKNAITWRFHQLPKLVYVPFVWGEQDQEDWRATNHLDRLAMLNARAGGISRKDVVMPIDLIFDEVERKSIRVNGYNGADTGCMATLAIVPRPYVGWVTQFQQNQDRFDFSGGFEDGIDGMCWYVTDHETLEKNGCAVANAEEVMSGLWKMYFAGKARSLIRHEDLLRAMIDFHKAWSASEDSTEP